MESIKKKGTAYVKKIPSRCFNILIEFIVIVLMYIAIQKHLLDKTFDLKYTIYSFFGWKSVGNSNWYVFIILAMYAITYFAFRLVSLLGNKDSFVSPMIIMIFTSLLFMAFMMHFKSGETRWYNTFLCYDLGMIYSLIKEKFEKEISKRSLLYFATLIIAVVSFIVFKSLRSDLLYYLLHTFSFCFIVVLVMMKLKINSRILKFLGSHVFSIYMLQRIPMIILFRTKLSPDINEYLKLYICFAITVVIAIIFDFVYGSITKFIKKGFCKLSKKKVAS